jgi:DNA polymerase I-like protein with 3'-5' exonuclease and polymerase domains
MEFKAVAFHINSESMLASLAAGECFHNKTATAISAPRDTAKTCNFNLIFGGHAKTLSEIII